VKSVVKSNQLFVIPFFIFIITGTVILFISSKTERHLTFNLFHNSFFDVFFYYATYLGDGFMALLLFIILLTIKYRFAILVGVSALFSSLFTQFLKHNFFEDALRPKKFFEGLHELYLVPGVENHSYYSFPSGHATTAFALYFSLALITKNNTLKLLLFALALIASYSRVYLSQHFFEDIYAGALIGTIITSLIFLVLQKSSAKWLEKSASSLFNQND
jgi:membrane-associated phospholipid phosphatase